MTPRADDNRLTTGFQLSTNPLNGYAEHVHATVTLRLKAGA